MSTPAIVTRVFSESDQSFFARASGDFNPMHMDATAARRTQAGAPVVHGVHATIWVLDVLTQMGLPVQSLTTLRVEFEKFIYLDREVAVRVLKSTDSMARVEVKDGELLLMTASLRFGVKKVEDDIVPEPDDRITPVGEAPDEPTIEEMCSLAGWLSPPAGAAELKIAYPNVCRVLGEDRIATLAQTSTLVGMICPGLHSIYSALSLRLVDGLPTRSGIGFRTLDVDRRVNMVNMSVAGTNIAGEVTAFVRQPPVRSRPMEDVTSRVERQEFSNVSALIVGGSRGLGAAAAAIVGAGGGRVFLTYARGLGEASEVCDEINLFRGMGCAKALALDVNDDLANQLACLENDITHIYYFATPHIGQQSSEAFSLPQFLNFCHFYVGRFFDICRYFLDRQPGRPLTVFYPSSVFVTDPPRGMIEYAMAKAAGEVLCKEIARYSPGVRVECPRIPRVATDQNASVVRLDVADPLEIMLPLMRTL